MRGLENPVRPAGGLENPVRPARGLKALVDISEQMQEDGYADYDSDCENAQTTFDSSNNSKIFYPLEITSSVTLENPETGEAIRPRAVMLSENCVVASPKDSDQLFGVCWDYRVASSVSQWGLCLRGVSVNGWRVFVATDENGQEHPLQNIRHRLQATSTKQYKVLSLPLTNTELQGGTPEERSRRFMPVVKTRRKARESRKLTRGLPITMSRPKIVIRGPAESPSTPKHSAKQPHQVASTLFGVLLKCYSHVEFKSFGDWLIQNDNGEFVTISDLMTEKDSNCDFETKSFERCVMDLMAIHSMMLTCPLTIRGRLVGNVQTILKRIGTYDGETQMTTFEDLETDEGCITVSSGKRLESDEMINEAAVVLGTTRNDIVDKYA